MKFKITPGPAEIDFEKGFDGGGDLFNYKPFGERFLNVVCNVVSPLTISFSGGWGSGKSTFIKQWCGHLRKNNVPVIYIDAFENDYQDDPFTIISSEILELISSSKSVDGREIKRIIKSARDITLNILPIATKIAIRAATFGALSTDEIKGLHEGVGKIVEDIGDVSSEYFEKIIEDRLANAGAARKELNFFRDSLRDAAAALPRGNEYPDAPLVFVIDELDRCRPDFSIKILERIKHFFSVEGVVFVLVNNMEHIEVSLVEGDAGGDSRREYFDKFYDIKVMLPVHNELRNSNFGVYVNYLWKSMGLEANDPRNNIEVRDGIVDMAVHFGLSLRTINKIVSNVSLTYAATSGRIIQLAPTIVVLSVLRQVNPRLYEKARNGTLDWADLEKFLGFSNWHKGRSGEWYSRWLRYFTDRNLDEGLDWVRQIENSLNRYALDDRLDFVAWSVGLMDNFEINRAVSTE